MSKELTEQWRNGTLKQKHYYVKYFGKGQKPFVEIELKNFLLDLVNVIDRYKIEVLAPVPSYDEYNELVQKMHKLEKQLSSISEQLDIITEQRNDIHIDKQVLQKQLNEANKIIKKLYKESGNPIGCDYLEKWSVK